MQSNTQGLQLHIQNKKRGLNFLGIFFIPIISSTIVIYCFLRKDFKKIEQVNSFLSWLFMKNIEKNNYVSKIFLIQNQYILNLLVTSFIGTELILHTKYILDERNLTYLYILDLVNTAHNPLNTIQKLEILLTIPLRCNVYVGNDGHNLFKV